MLSVISFYSGSVWTDRVLWVGFPGCGTISGRALLILTSETVIAWHRKGLRLYWKWKSRHARMSSEPTSQNRTFSDASRGELRSI